MFAMRIRAFAIERLPLLQEMSEDELQAMLGPPSAWALAACTHLEPFHSDERALDIRWRKANDETQNAS
jgi:hypothetical protein